MLYHAYQAHADGLAPVQAMARAAASWLQHGAFGLGALPPRYMADGKPGRISQAALFAHELNHDCGKTRGVSRTDSEACPVRAENRVRAAQGLVLRKTHNIDPAGN